MTRTWITITIFIAVLLALFWYWNSKRVVAGSMDCLTGQCYDKEGNLIAKSNCDKIGLTC